ncbi:PDF receptor-like [Mizuhopecten yessoensis]|uniref:PDF receptor n=1 Tax=Mizuhopecten yessoensis TaxID=6573 RepID=A0A210QMU7_MIZYE|nr:PDF receptor-like [Mizuhopecten yessoensis]OWF50062.1 PDF receptor [Mizuhopecten yessoensis]
MEKSTGNLYPTNLKECLESQGEKIYKFPKPFFCNATWDTVLCWPPTLKGVTFKIACPEHLGVGPDKFAYKTCGNDGGWAGVHPGFKEYPDWEPGWTNYSECAGVIYETVTEYNDTLDVNVSEAAPISFGTLPLTYDGADILACVLLSMSIIFTMAAIGISCFSKGIQATRVRLYRNLFAAFLFHDMLDLVMNIGRILRSSDVINDVKPCVAIGVLVTLTSSAIFVWLLILGIYYLLTMKSVVIERRMYFVLCLLGWFVPTVITITWLSITVIYGKTYCWFGELFIATLQSSFWIIESTNMFFLALTWFFIIYFLCKYNDQETSRRHNENKELAVELGNIRSSAIKIVIILAFVTVAYLVYMAFAHNTSSEPLAYMFVLTVYSRGVLTPIFLCFFDENSHCWDGFYNVISTDNAEDSDGASTSSMSI